MKKEVKAIIFDVGGVLALGKNSKIGQGKMIPSRVHLDMAGKLNVSIDQYLDLIDKDYALAIEGKISKEKVLKIFAKNFKNSPKKLEKLYVKYYRKYFKQNKQLFKQAFKLRKKGYKIAILSDQWPLSKDALMPEKFYKNFDDFVISYEVGVRKPNLKIYKLILKKLKLSPRQTLFIDNQKGNLGPAKKLGMKTILFKDNKQLFQNKIWKGLFK